MYEDFHLRASPSLTHTRAHIRIVRTLMLFQETMVEDLKWDLYRPLTDSFTDDTIWEHIFEYDNVRYHTRFCM